MDERTYTVKGELPAVLSSLLGKDALSEAGAADLRVLLALLALGSATPARLAEALGCGTSAVAAALAFWRGAGLITPLTPEADGSEGDPREPGAEELAERIAASATLAELVRTVEQQRARMLTRSDLTVLVRLSEELSLDAPYILTLLAFCDAQGDGRAKPLRYLERVAYRLHEHGVDSYRALEEYIREQELLRSVEGGLRRMFGIGTRRLTEREEHSFLTWTQEYGYGEELIGAAYDLTVNTTGKASVAYTAKILAHWHEAGVVTLADAEALLARERAEKGKSRTPARTRKPKGAPRSFDAGDFFQRAIERSFKKNSDTTEEN